MNFKQFPWNIFLPSQIWYPDSFLRCIHTQIFKSTHCGKEGKVAFRWFLIVSVVWSDSIPNTTGSHWKHFGDSSILVGWTSALPRGIYNNIIGIWICCFGCLRNWISNYYGVSIWQSNASHHWSWLCCRHKYNSAVNRSVCRVVVSSALLVDESVTWKLGSLQQNTFDHTHKQGTDDYKMNALYPYLRKQLIIDCIVWRLLHF